MKTYTFHEAWFACRLYRMALVIGVAFLLATNFASAAERYWVGANGSWSDDNNWAETSGAAGPASVPSASDTAIFDANGTGDCLIDVTASVAGIDIRPGYDGTITQQDGVTITVGDIGFVQADGAFAGGNAKMTTEYFTLAGGIFTAPQAVLNIQSSEIRGTVFTWTGGVFEANGGTLQFNGWFNSSHSRWQRIDLGGAALTVNHLVYTGGNDHLDEPLGYQLAEANDVLIVNGDFTIEPDTDRGANATVQANQGTIQVHGNLIIGAGADGGSTVVEMTGSNHAEYTYVSGKGPGLKIDKDAAATVTPAAGTINLAFEIFALAGGDFTAPDGVMSIGYPSHAPPSPIFSITGGEFVVNSGTLKFNSLFGASASYEHVIDLDGASLTVRNLIYSGGNTGGGDLRYRLNSGDDLFIAEGDFLMEADTASGANATVGANGGTIRLHGNLTVKGGSIGGTTIVELIGSDNAEYTYDGGKAPHLKISKDESVTVSPAAGTTEITVEYFSLHSGTFVAPSGTISVEHLTHTPSFAVFSRQGGDFVHNDGTLRFNSRLGTLSSYDHDIDLNGEVLGVYHLTYTGGGSGNGHVRYRLGSGSDTFVVRGDLLLEGDGNRTIQANAGKMQAHGDVTVQNGIVGGTTSIALMGEHDQDLRHPAGTPPTVSWTIDKPAGTVALRTDLTLGGSSQDLIWTQGRLDLGTNTLNVGRNLAVDAGTLAITVADAGVAGRLTVTGAATGIDNVDLEVLVDASMAAVQGQTFTILSNDVVLSEEFASVSWSSSWMGNVTYDENGGKNVTLADIRKPAGTMIMLK